MLITASPRLVTEWKRRLLLNMSEEVVATPMIYFWDEWLTHLANHATDSPVPLTKIQELLLWEKVIRNSLNSDSLSRHTSLKGLSRRASEAYAIMQEYQIDLSELALGGEESEALAQWAEEIKSELKTSKLKQRALIADIPSLLCSALPEQILPKSIILDGFEPFTPVQQQLLDHLKEKGCDILTVCSDQPSTVPTLTPCPDEMSEFHQVASRIKSLLEIDPLMRISILTSDSFSDSNSLRRKLNRVLMPESRVSPFCDQQAVMMPGDALSDWPMIQQTLHLLSLAGKGIVDFSDFSTLLFSPWIRGFEEERMERAALDARFRRQNRHRLSLRKLLESSDIESLPEFHAAIKEVHNWPTSSRSASQWVKEIHSLLQITGIAQAGLDDEVPRSNIEIRQMNAFKDALISLVSADAIHSSMTWTRFLSMLNSACSEVKLTLTARYPNITVMPLTQITGLCFDHIFVLAMDEQALPSAARPQPLLPLSLQKRYGIPGSHGALQFDASTRLWQQLLQASSNIEISYAEQKDVREIQPSSFVDELEEKEAAHTEITEQMAELESYEDAIDLALQPDEQVRGGTAVIKNQSACPFRAFATHRMGISALEETSPGLEPTSKGSLIHLALEYIWKELQTHAALTALNSDETTELIDASIQYAWHESSVVAGAMTQAYEQKRMQRVLSEWMQLELERPAFKVIGIEQEYLLQLPETSSPQFSVKIKADRMDQDGSGHRILIDYKTGEKQSTSKWLNERIEEPQLPQYALAARLGINDAVAFARVRSGDMAYEGLCKEDIGIKGIVACDGKRNTPDDWQQVLDEWKTNINALAFEFVNGRSDVSPRNANACKYCGFEAICRIEEIGFVDEPKDLETQS